MYIDVVLHSLLCGSGDVLLLSTSIFLNYNLESYVLSEGHAKMVEYDHVTQLIS